MPPFLRYLGRGCLAVLLGVALGGCASVPLDAARRDFYEGRFDRAEGRLRDAPIPTGKRALFLMERGMIAQTGQDYAESTRDWLEAVEEEDALETYSLSQAAASLVVNDRTMDFRGAPFERTLLHTFLAANYMTQGMWEDAAVEGRRAIGRLQDLQGFPDDAFSRYVAGFTLERMSDWTGAALQYRMASNLLAGVRIDDRTGRLAPVPAAAGTNEPVQAEPAPQSELVCLILMGRAPDPLCRRECAWGGAPYADITAGSNWLGRSYVLADVAQLAEATAKRRAAMQAAKFAMRVAVKAAIWNGVRHVNRDLGDLLEFLFIVSELPDDRYWETLPQWLEVARVPCPAGLTSFDVSFRDSAGRLCSTLTVRQPIARDGRVFFAVCRDIPPAEPLPRK